METQGYADEVLMSGWTEVPRLPPDAPPTALRLAEREPEARGPSPFADPDFIARVYRSQR